jgi:hypothetical protein
MNGKGTQQKILDAVDAGFDAQRGLTTGSARLEP